MIDWETEKAGSLGDVTVFKLTECLESIESDYLLSVIENRIGHDETKVVLDCAAVCQDILEFSARVLVTWVGRRKPAAGC